MSAINAVVKGVLIAGFVGGTMFAVAKIAEKRQREREEFEIKHTQLEWRLFDLRKRISAELAKGPHHGRMSDFEKQMWKALTVHLDTNKKIREVVRLASMKDWAESYHSMLINSNTFH